MTKEEYRKHIEEVFKCQYERLMVVTATELKEKCTKQKPKPKNKEKQSEYPKRRKRNNYTIRQHMWMDV